MHCNEAQQQLEHLDRVDEVAAGSELEAHLQECEACRDYARERQLVELLASLPVREPEPGLEDRVLRQALGRSRPSAAGVHLRLALATAASVALAVLVTLQFHSQGDATEPVEAIQTAVVKAQLQQTRMVDVLFTSPRRLDDALITVQLEDNLALEGYNGIHNLQWRTTLKSGHNKLSLPVRLLQGESARLTVVVEHEGARKRFTVLVDAAPDDGGQTLSRV